MHWTTQRFWYLCYNSESHMKNVNIQSRKKNNYEKKNELILHLRDKVWVLCKSHWTIQRFWFLSNNFTSHKIDMYFHVSGKKREDVWFEIDLYSIILNDHNKFNTNVMLYSLSITFFHDRCSRIFPSYMFQSEFFIDS